MSNKLYRYKQLAFTRIDEIGRTVHQKAWSKPITMIRKRGDLTCEGCYFSTAKANTPDPCKLMLKTKQLPTCAPHFIFVKVLYNEKSKTTENCNKAQEY